MSVLVLSLQLNCNCWIFFVLNSLDMESWRGLGSLVGYFFFIWGCFLPGGAVRSHTKEPEPVGS